MEQHKRGQHKNGQHKKGFLMELDNLDLKEKSGVYKKTNSPTYLYTAALVWCCSWPLPALPPKTELSYDHWSVLDQFWAESDGCQSPLSALLLQPSLDCRAGDGAGTTGFGSQSSFNEADGWNPTIWSGSFQSYIFQ